MIGLGLGLGMSGGSGIGTAPDYVEPVGDTPVDPPIGDPVPPTDTPTDPDTSNPEPGIDPDFVMATRIDITDSGQTAVRTTNDPGTVGVAYVATAVSGDEYWEYKVETPTPNNATFMVGITTLDMPLNGIPGERATEIAWWSDGRVRQNGVTLIDLGAGGALARGDTAGVAINAAGAVFLYKNCVALNSGTTVGTLAPVDPIYPFVALYSTKTKINMNFSNSTFNCAVPSGFYPLGQAPVVPWVPSDAVGTMTHWFKADAGVIKSGASVTTWEDQSGNSSNLTSVASKEPVTDTVAFGGAESLYFNGDVMGLTGDLFPTTGFIVYAPDSAIDHTATGAVLLSKGGSAAASQYYALGSITSFLTNEVIAFRGTGSGRDSGISNAALASISAGGHILSGRLNAVSTLRYELHHDGGTAVDNIGTSGNEPVWTSTDFRVGAFSDAGANAFIGHIAEIVIFSDRLSDGDFEKMEGYLAHKWSIEANLPVDHPYKSSAP